MLSRIVPNSWLAFIPLLREASWGQIYKKFCNTDRCAVALMTPAKNLSAGRWIDSSLGLFFGWLYLLIVIQDVMHWSFCMVWFGRDHYYYDLYYMALFGRKIWFRRELLGKTSTIYIQLSLHIKLWCTSLYQILKLTNCVVSLQCK